MKQILESWREYLDTLEILDEAKVYSLGDEYSVSFHPDNIIYIQQRGANKKKWRLQTDDEQFNHVRQILMKADPYQVEVTKDELLRGRMGKLVVVGHAPFKDREDQEVNDLDDIDIVL